MRFKVTRLGRARDRDISGEFNSGPTVFFVGFRGIKEVLTPMLPLRMAPQCVGMCVGASGIGPGEYTPRGKTAAVAALADAAVFRQRGIRRGFRARIFTLAGG